MGEKLQQYSPVIPIHQQWLDEFESDFWAYYYQLKDYRQSSPEQRQQQKLQLEAEFDRLFSRVTGYDDLDHRLSLTLLSQLEVLYSYFVSNLLIYNTFCILY